MPGKSLPWQMLGDAQLELGDLDDAAKSYAEMTRLDDGSASTETRLARLATMRGRLDKAREHLEAALDIVEQQGVANPDLVIWTRVQLGELAFKRGDWDGADAHFHAALEIAPEHWSVLEHVAELEAARGHDAGAVAFYERAIAKAARPELWQALGDYHAFAKRPDDAKRCHEKALAGYRASIDRGELLYVHHLAGFFADSQEDAAEAVKWARRDMEQRHGALAWDALAWALYRQGDIPASLAATKKALATGIADPHVLYHAAMIHLSAGEISAGQSLLKRCAEVNPHFNAFHAHR